jgi:hypothetical protein
MKRFFVAFLILSTSSCSIIDRAKRERMHEEYNSLTKDQKILYLNMQPDINHATRMDVLKYLN